MNRTTLFGSIGIGVLLVAIAAADFAIVERPRMLVSGGEESSSASSEASSEMQSSEATSSQEPVPKGVSRGSGPDVSLVLGENGFVWSDTDEEGILAQSAPNVQRGVLLMDDDRAAFMAWTEVLNAKELFSAMKTSLAEGFSGDVNDLVDETVRPEGMPPRDVLAFKDPKFGEERHVFIRVKTRLFEFHVPEGKDELIVQLIEKLAR